MDIADRIALARAGYKKKDIEALIEEENKQPDNNEPEDTTSPDVNTKTEEPEDTTDYKKLSEELLTQLKEANEKIKESNEKIKKIQTQNVNTDTSSKPNEDFKDVLDALI